MASNNYIYKMSNAGGMATVTRYTDMLAGNTTWSPWEPQGAYDALATITLTATTASVTFAGIPTGYKHLQIRTFANANNSDIFMQFNSDTTNNYSVHYVYGDGSSANAGGSGNVGYVNMGFYPTTSGIFGTSICDILDYANTSKNKTTRTLSGGDANGSGLIVLYSGNWRSTSAINSIRIYPNAGGSFTQNSQFALYGVR